MQQMFGQFLSKCPIAIIRLNNSLEIVESNGAFKRDFTGLGLSETTKLSSLFCDADFPALLSKLLQLQRGDAVNVKQAAIRTAEGTHWFDIDAHLIEPELNDGGFLLYLQDVTQAKNTDAFVDSVSANLLPMQGEDYFNNVCQFLSEKLNYEFAFIGRLIDERNIEAVGGIANGEILDSLVYNLEDTPCDGVVGKQCCVYPDSIQSLFPKDLLLQEMGVESYIGSPLFDSQGKAIGIIVLLSARPILNAKLAQATIEIFSERVSNGLVNKLQTEMLEYQASHDSLCDIANRRTFRCEVERALANAKKSSTESALLYIDLDQFKVINDSCGHAAGDSLLKQTSGILSSVIGDTGCLARLGGDEFGVLVPSCGESSAAELATTILRELNQLKFVWQNFHFRSAASIGITIISAQSDNVERIFQQADTACYIAKDKGRNRFECYRADAIDMSRHETEIQWVSKLNDALQNNSFTLYAQPIAQACTNMDAPIRHYELLIRMLDSDHKTILPNSFLGSAERYNLIGQIDHWVIENSLYLLANHPNFVEQIEFVSINLSGQSLCDNSIASKIESSLAKYDIPPEKICFEVTETNAISNLSDAKALIQRLQRLGCKFALDDFGTGLSSLSYLKHLPVDILKIDGSFVLGIATDSVDRVMVKCVQDMASHMGMRTIAEFVENAAIEAVLVGLGVDLLQGYHIAKPQPFESILSQFQPCLEVENF